MLCKNRKNEICNHLERILTTKYPDCNFNEMFSEFFDRYKRMNFNKVDDERLLLIFDIFIHDKKLLDLDGEVWRDITGYEGYYQVSSFGRVKSLDRYVNSKNGSTKLWHGKILNPEIDRLGYRFVHVSKEGIDDRFLIHRLVAEGFINNPDNLPCVNHKDERPWNNCVGNLEWCTYAYNNQYNELNRKRFATRTDNIENGTVKLGIPIVQLGLDGSYIQEWANAERIMKATGYNASQIHAVCKHKRKTTKGYRWMYKEEYERNLNNEKPK